MTARVRGYCLACIACLLLFVLPGIAGGEAESYSAAPIRLSGKSVAYQPRGACRGHEEVFPTEAQIRDDLRLLRRIGFRSLVTYGARGVFGSIPRLARQEGFDGALIMGIWDPFSTEELKAAVAHTSFVEGYCLGNEGLGLRYTPRELGPIMDGLRKASGRPVTTSEMVDRYIEGGYSGWLRAQSDWLFPLGHPFWAGQRNVGDAVDWLVARHDYLVAVSGKQVVFKEAGLPTAGADACDEEKQASFFKAFGSTGLRFFYFEAFDQPCKKNSRDTPQVEAHWGLFKADGTPKKVVRRSAEGQIKP
jgi:exo-beta-1,3-glucanase (GH17 family)